MLIEPVSLTIGLLLLPFLPASFSWIRGQNSWERPRLSGEAYVPDYFPRRLLVKLQATVSAPEPSDDKRARTLSNGQTVAVLPRECSKSQQVQSDILYAFGDLVLPPRGQELRDIVSLGTVEGGEDGVYRALCAVAGLHLKKGTTVLRWCHSDHNVVVEADSSIHGRLTAGCVVRLGATSLFTTIVAPSIVVGDDLIQDRDSLILALERPLLVRGPLHIPPGTQRASSIKAYQNIEIGSGSHIGGAVVCSGNIVVNEGVTIDGCLIAEGDIVMHPRCQVGHKNKRATVSGRRIELGVGSVVHGRIQAYQEAVTGI